MIDELKRIDWEATSHRQQQRAKTAEARVAKLEKAVRPFVRAMSPPAISVASRETDTALWRWTLRDTELCDDDWERARAALEDGEVQNDEG